MGGRRTAAVVGLLSTALAVAAIATATADRFPRGLGFIAALVAALTLAWWSIPRAAVVRTVGLVAAVLIVGGGIAFVATHGGLLLAADLVGAGFLLIALVAAKRALTLRAELPPAARPQRAVLIYNPKSGGGKATKFHLADEARKRGIEPHELMPETDLRALVRELIASGADALAAAGGDGTQALVASEAAAHDLPYACIPAGTRNHFALDLGVDRDDVVGALDSLVDGRERRVDLAEVNGRVFVNNVSLGIYAEAVQKSGYRDAKLRTLIGTVPEAMGRNSGDPNDFRWDGPDGTEKRSPAVLLVSNDPYRLGRGVGSGTRPQLDAGVLGIAAFDLNGAAAVALRRANQWSASDFEVRAAGSLPLGVDGEAMVMDAPLQFRSRPGVLRALIAPHHPGASPSAAMPSTPWGVLRKLFGVALGRSG